MVEVEGLLPERATEISPPRGNGKTLRKEREKATSQWDVTTDSGPEVKKSLRAVNRRYGSWGAGKRGRADERKAAHPNSVINFYFAGASIAERRSGVASTLSKCA